MTDKQKLEKAKEQLKHAGTIHRKDLIRQIQRLNRKIRANQRNNE